MRTSAQRTVHINNFAATMAAKRAAAPATSQGGRSKKAEGEVASKKPATGAKQSGHADNSAVSTPTRPKAAGTPAPKPGRVATTPTRDRTSVAGQKRRAPESGRLRRNGGDEDFHSEEEEEDSDDREFRATDDDEDDDDGDDGRDRRRGRRGRRDEDDDDDPDYENDSSDTDSDVDARERRKLKIEAQIEQEAARRVIPFKEDFALRVLSRLGADVTFDANALATVHGAIETELNSATFRKKSAKALRESMTRRAQLRARRKTEAQTVRAVREQLRQADDDEGESVNGDDDRDEREADDDSAAAPHPSPRRASSSASSPMVDEEGTDVSGGVKAGAGASQA